LWPDSDERQISEKERCRREEIMAITNEKELFVFLLSDLRQSAQCATKILREIAKAAQHSDIDIKEALQARVLISTKIIATLDEAFNLIGEAPAKASAPLHDFFMEDFRRELAGIKSLEARRLFILVKTNHVIHRRIGEYVTLITLADVTAHYGVRVLLESCLADNVAFVETTQRLMLEPTYPKPVAKAVGEGGNGA
jgi:ferritin-like metal-binding protein YciE